MVIGSGQNLMRVDPDSRTPSQGQMQPIGGHLPEVQSQLSNPNQVD